MGERGVMGACSTVSTKLDFRPSHKPLHTQYKYCEQCWYEWSCLCSPHGQVRQCHVNFLARQVFVKNLHRCVWGDFPAKYVCGSVRLCDTFDTVCGFLIHLILCAIVWWYCVQLFDDTVCDCLIHLILCAIVWWYSVQLFDDTVCNCLMILCACFGDTVVLVPCVFIRHKLIATLHTSYSFSRKPCMLCIHCVVFFCDSQPCTFCTLVIRASHA